MAIDVRPATQNDGLTYLLASLSACVLCVASIIATIFDTPAANAASAAFFLFFLLFCQVYFGLRERLLLALAGLATVAAILQLGSNAAGPVMADLSRAAYLATFIMLMASLREGAMHSSAVLAIGRYLTGQPTGRRYMALHIGGHFVGVILNFGAISLLGPLIKRGVDSKAGEGPPVLSEIRLRRQISALSRGFAWFNIWAPTAIAQAVVLTLVPGSRAGIIAIAGIVTALILLFVGWAEDRLTGQRARQRLAQDGNLPTSTHVPIFPGAQFIRFGVVATSLIVLAIVISRLVAIPLVSAIMMASVPVTLAWMGVQWRLRREPDIGSLVHRAKVLFRTSIPAGSPEAATLGLAGYIGILSAGLVNRSWLADTLSLESWNPTMICISVTAIIPLASCIGLPPMMVVTFLGGLLVSVPQLDLQPTLLGFALLVGWALNLTGSPFGATSLMLTRVIDISGAVYAWKWNGLFTLISWAVAAIVILVLGTLLG